MLFFAKKVQKRIVFDEIFRRNLKIFPFSMNFYDFLKSKFLSIPETVTNFRQRLDLHEARIKNLTKKI